MRVAVHRDQPTASTDQRTCAKYATSSEPDPVPLHRNAEGSTLRKTLGILLADELGIELRRVGTGTRMTFGTGEQALSMWMSHNAFVSWIVDPEPWILEAQLIAELDVPLNLEGNAHNAFHPELSAARSRAVGHARSLPPIANPGIGGR